MAEVSAKDSSPHLDRVVVPAQRRHRWVLRSHLRSSQLLDAGPALYTYGAGEVAASVAKGAVRVEFDGERPLATGDARRLRLSSSRGDRFLVGAATFSDGAERALTFHVAGTAALVSTQGRPAGTARALRLTAYRSDHSGQVVSRSVAEPLTSTAYYLERGTSDGHGGCRWTGGLSVAAGFHGVATQRQVSRDDGDPPLASTRGVVIARGACYRAALDELMPAYWSRHYAPPASQGTI